MQTLMGVLGAGFSMGAPIALRAIIKSGGFIVRGLLSGSDDGETASFYPTGQNTIDPTKWGSENVGNGRPQRIPSGHGRNGAGQVG